ncbi:hypothetical protein QNI16_05660 [Cytophagaceae bacterium YF14B1]|uniref:Uncharacterized protein n=1 Tax=Xanthocytophaga flava TaxID=3048013 RepID=A0AAE3QNH9_9BACT|nr:hypothetical protein [Xanthocytophaga flavus]MDJ1479964.1 hypothetical protein [Xanthocytophaga flavus]
MNDWINPKRYSVKPDHSRMEPGRPPVAPYIPYVGLQIQIVPTRNQRPAESD